MFREKSEKLSEEEIQEQNRVQILNITVHYRENE